MERHANSHRQNKPTKIYLIRGTRGDFRPAEHIWNASMREYHQGGDALLHSVEPPSDMLIGGEIVCRKCKKKSAGWPPHADPHSKSAVLSKLIEHEKYCAGKC
jgi:hypothetical protein